MLPPLPRPLALVCCIVVVPMVARAAWLWEEKQDNSKEVEVNAAGDVESKGGS